MKIIYPFLLAISLLSMSFIGTEQIRLGAGQIDLATGEGEIIVSPHSKPQEAIQISVAKAVVFIVKVEVFFGNNTQKSFDVNLEFKSDDFTHELSLTGNTASIERVHFTFKPIAEGGRAVVQLWGSN